MCQLHMLLAVAGSEGALVDQVVGAVQREDARNERQESDQGDGSHALMGRKESAALLFYRWCFVFGSFAQAKRCCKLWFHLVFFGLQLPAAIAAECKNVKCPSFPEQKPFASQLRNCCSVRAPLNE